MAERRVTTAAFVWGLCCLVVVGNIAGTVSGAIVLSHSGDRPEARRVPLYVHKARLYLERQQAYERTMQGRMKTLSQALDGFSTQLYLQHVKENSGSVLLSPLSAYTSLAMALSASQSTTKREILTAMKLSAEGRGIHTSVQRAVKSLLDDDTDDVNSDLSAERDLGSLMQNDDPDVELSYKDLENIIRNDYLMDSSISYNTGQTHIKYSTAVKTSDQKKDVPLSSDNPADSDLFLRLASGMFHSEEVALSQHFSNRVVSLYGAPPMAMQQEDPASSVNLWVDAVSRGLIPHMLAPDAVTNETLLVLVNAFSFWGSWQANFDKKELIPLEFQTLDGDSVIAQSMYRTGNYSVKNLPEIGAKVLEIPYSNTRYSLYVFLPRASARLRDVERGLKIHKLHTLLQDMPEPTMTIVLLPKFHLRSRVSLRAELKRQGVQRLFSKKKADLRRMTGEEKSSLFVNDFFQYAAFEVNEGVESDAKKNTITIGADWDASSANILDTVSNNSSHIHISDTDSQLDENENEDGEDNHEDEDYNQEYDDYDYEDYEYEEEAESIADSNNYFIADKSFLFLVKDKQYDLVLLMGRMTNPLP
ncbi:hypothetical protein ACOMHN_020674 [Nucella lapillus]